jgi:hypothetical protein
MAAATATFNIHEIGQRRSTDKERPESATKRRRSREGAASSMGQVVELELGDQSSNVDPLEKKTRCGHG